MNVPVIVRSLGRSLVVGWLMLGGLSCGGSGDGGTEPPSALPEIYHPSRGLRSKMAIRGLIEGLAISPSGTFAILNTQQGYVQFGTLTDSSEALGDSLPVLRPRNVALSPDGALAYVVNDACNCILVATTQPARQIGLINLRERAWNILITPDGRRLFVVGAATHILELDAATYAVVDTTPLPDSAASSIFSYDPASALLYVGVQDSLGLYAMDPVGDTVVASFAFGGPPIRMQVAPGGGRLFVQAGEIFAYDRATGTRTSIPGLTSRDLMELRNFAVSPDGAQLWALTVDPIAAWNLVRVHDAQTLSLLSSDNRYATSPRYILMSGNGHVALIGEENVLWFVR